MHYGLLPRANRGIFAINELPDLAGKIQVALFNIMQEGDVQIKGYPVRLALDVALVFSRQPRGLHRPRQNRHAAQRPHRLRDPHPLSRDPSRRASPSPRRKPGVRIAADLTIRSPRTTSARSSSRSPSPPAKTRKSTSAPASRSACPSPPWSSSSRTPNAAPCCMANRSSSPASATSTPRFPASPARSSSNTKARCRAPTPSSARSSAPPSPASSISYFADTNTQQIEQWFNLGGSVQLNDSQPAEATLAELEQIQGLFEKLSPLGINARDAPEKIVAAAEFLLEGLYAHKKLSRSEERGFSAQDRARATAERSQERRDESREYEQWQQRRSNKQRSGLN